MTHCLLCLSYRLAAWSLIVLKYIYPRLVYMQSHESQVYASMISLHAFVYTLPYRQTAGANMPTIVSSWWSHSRPRVAISSAAWRDATIVLYLHTLQLFTL